MKIVYRAALTLFVFFWLASAKASLLSQNHPVFGANSITLDTSTGLAWLDLTFDTGYSYNQMLAALQQPGGMFAGFRYATQTEVVGLFADGNIPGSGEFNLPSPMSGNIQAMITLVGQTSSQDGHPETFGISGTGGGTGANRFQDVLGFDFLYTNGGPTYEIFGSGATLGYGPAFGPLTVGNWLVYQTPEPSANLLVVLGSLILLAGSRFKLMTTSFWAKRLFFVRLLKHKAAP